MQISGHQVHVDLVYCFDMVSVLLGIPVGSLVGLVRCCLLVHGDQGVIASCRLSICLPTSSNPPYPEGWLLLSYLLSRLLLKQMFSRSWTSWLSRQHSLIMTQEVPQQIRTHCNRTPRAEVMKNKEHSRSMSRKQSKLSWLTCYNLLNRRFCFLTPED